MTVVVENVLMGMTRSVDKIYRGYDGEYGKK